MPTRALWLRLILPVGLIALVGVLATLQYQWLGTVSAAERERLQTSLHERASEFADDFDRELLRVYLAFQGNSAGLHAGDVSAFARGYDAWHDDTRYPEIVRGVYLASNDGATLRRYDPDRRVFVAAEWPDAFAPIRQLDPEIPLPGPGDKARAITILRQPVVASIPALLVPVPSYSPTDPPAPGNVLSVRFGDMLIVHLDRDALRSKLLPDLVAKHFPNGDAAGTYRFEVIDTDSRAPVLERGLAPGASLDPAHADVTVPLFSLRFDLSNQVSPRTFVFDTRSTLLKLPAPTDASPHVTADAGTARWSIYVESRGRAGALRASATTFNRPAWELVLQHPAGSLDAAVAATRARNLWLGFGILAILAVGMGLVVVNAHRSERLAAQQMDFVATVSHELRTPLAVIRSAAQNLSAGVIQEPAQARRYGDLIETEGRRLTAMVEQVLEFAGLNANRHEPAAQAVHPAAVVRDVVSSAAAQLEAAHCQVDLTLAQDVPPARVDEDALRRALQNLVANAIKYGAQGRWIGIALSRGVWHGQTEVLISVSDRGRGVDPEDLPHIFEPFYRGRYAKERQIHGNGLGLSLVRRIAEVHAGRVTVKSSPGEGATFTLHLPAATPDPAPQPIADPSPQTGSTRG